MKLNRVRKRDGREVPFDVTKIETAVGKALAAVGEEDDAFAAEVAALVRMTLEARGSEGQVPNIEDIQDLVEQALIELGRARIAKAYILYRDRRTRVRAALRVDLRTDAHLPEAEPASAEHGANTDSLAHPKPPTYPMGEEPHGVGEAMSWEPAPGEPGGISEATLVTCEGGYLAGSSWEVGPNTCVCLGDGTTVCTLIGEPSTGPAEAIK